MKPETREGKKKKPERNVRNAKFSFVGGQIRKLWELFFIGSQKRLTSFGFLACRKKQKIYHINLIFITFQSLLLTRRKMENRMRNPKFSSALRQGGGKSICKNRFRCENSCSDHHVLLPHSLPFLETTNIPGRWFIEPENFERSWGGFLFERFCWFSVWFSVAYVGWKLQAFIMRQKVVWSGEKSDDKELMLRYVRTCRLLYSFHYFIFRG